MNFNRPSSYARPTQNRFASFEEEMQQMRNRNRIIRRLILVGIAVIASLVISFFAFTAYSYTITSTHTSCTVVDKDRVMDEGSSDMRIYTQGCDGGVSQVFTMNDRLVLGQYDSADSYNNIKVGQRYDFETTGVRVPLLSLFENIKAVSLSH